MGENERDALIERARAVIQADGQAVLATSASVDDAFVAAAGIISNCKGKVLVTGAGTSGAIASRAAHLLSVGGTPAFYLPPGEGLHGGLGVLRPDDIVLAMSKGGSSAEINEFCRLAKTLCGGLVVITASPTSEFASLADHVIVMNLPDEADLGAVVATGSSLAAAAITDALVEVARVARNYGWDRFFYTHPSGSVGRDAETSMARLHEAEAR